MFRKPSFAYIQFHENLIDKSLSSISETDAVKLQESITQFMKQNKLKEADLHAKKMALFHGVPGLVNLYKINKIQLMELQKKHEVINQLALNLLCYLYVAKELYRASSAKQKQAIQQFLPDEEISKPEYWETLIDELCKLGNISAPQKQEAKNLGLKMLGASPAPLRGKTGMTSK